MSQTQIEQIEMSIEEAKKVVERGERAKRLATNPDFKALVLDGYFTEEAARLVHLMSDPTLNDQIRECIQRDMVGIGGFKRYLRTLVQMGDIAAHEIQTSHETLDEIRAEDLEESDE